MATKTIDLSTITNVVRNGVQYDSLKLGGSSNKTLWSRVWTPSSVSNQVDTAGYWTSQASYNTFVETSSVRGSVLGWWNTGPSDVGQYYERMGDPFGEQIPGVNGRNRHLYADFSYTAYSTYSWDYIAVPSMLFGMYEGNWWQTTKVTYNGYWTTIYPPAYYTAVYTAVSTDTSHYTYFY